VSARTRGRLAGKVAIVTGASQGIGQAIALAFAREGAHVVAAARDVANLRETARLAGRGSVVTRACDVTRETDVQNLVTFAEATFGGLHAIVNNAGIGVAAPLTELTEEDWDATMAVNVKGTFLGCKHAIPALIRAGGGAVVNVGSVAAFVGHDLGSAYIASKGAVLMLTKAAAREHAAAGVRVNVVCPGATMTPMEERYLEALGDPAAGRRWMDRHQPLTGILEPEDVASVAVFLASDESKGMTGSSVVVDGGLTAAWDHNPAPLPVDEPVEAVAR